MQNVIVIFEASQQQTESNALAFGLGAVQGGANIRLRHLNPSPDVILAHQSYGTLQVSDFAWAEGIALFLESETQQLPLALSTCLEGLAEDGSARPKWAFVVGPHPLAPAVQTVLNLLPKKTQIMQDSRPMGSDPASCTQLGRQFAKLE